MFMQNLKILLLTAFLILLSSCGDQKEEKDSVGASDKVIFTKGDPNVVVAGAQFNRVGWLTEANAADMTQFSMITIHQFKERESVLNTKTRNLSKEAAPKDRTTRNTTMSAAVQMRKLTSGEWQMSSRSGRVNIVFTVSSSGRLEPVRSGGTEPFDPVSPLHWSVSADGNYMSLLVNGTGAVEGRSLIAFYFERNTSTLATIETTDGQYNYLAGPGKKLGWKLAADQELQIQLCGAPQLNQAADTAVTTWAKILKGRLPIKFSQTNKYFPFSDLNQHCVYLVDSYLSMIQEDYFNYAITIPIFSIARAEMKDADVFIQWAEFQKLINFYVKHGRSRSEGEERAAKMIPYTLIHELGHVLGLDHKAMKGDPDEGVATVMSYKFEKNEPQAYDIEAVQLLYPARTQSLTN